MISAFRPRLVAFLTVLAVLVSLVYFDIAAVSCNFWGFFQLAMYFVSFFNVRAGIAPSPVEYALSGLMLFNTGVSRATSNSWVMVICSALGAFYTVAGSYTSTRATLTNRIALMTHLSATTELYVRREARSGIVCQILYASTDFQSLMAGWNLVRRGVGMPKFKISFSFMLVISAVALFARHVSVTALLVSQLSGTPLFVTEAGKIQPRIIQGFFRAAFSDTRADSTAFIVFIIICRNPVATSISFFVYLMVEDSTSKNISASLLQALRTIGPLQSRADAGLRIKGAGDSVSLDLEKGVISEELREMFQAFQLGVDQQSALVMDAGALQTVAREAIKQALPDASDKQIDRIAACQRQTTGLMAVRACGTLISSCTYDSVSTFVTPCHSFTGPNGEFHSCQTAKISCIWQGPGSSRPKSSGRQLVLPLRA